MNNKLKLSLALASVVVLAACAPKQDEYRSVEPFENGTQSTKTEYSQGYHDGFQAGKEAVQKTERKVVRTTKTKVVPVYQKVQTKVVDNTIPRDAYGKPIYAQMESLRGAFAGKTWKVNKGDSWFLLHFLSGKSINELQNLNGTTVLKSGSSIRL